MKKKENLGKNLIILGDKMKMGFDLAKIRTLREAHIIWKNLPHGFEVY